MRQTLLPERVRMKAESVMHGPSYMDNRSSMSVRIWNARGHASARGGGTLGIVSLARLKVAFNSQPDLKLLTSGVDAARNQVYTFGIQSYSIGCGDLREFGSLSRLHPPPPNAITLSKLSVIACSTFRVPSIARTFPLPHRSRPLRKTAASFVR